MVVDIEELHALTQLRSTLEAFAIKRWRALPGRVATEQRLKKWLPHLKNAATCGDYTVFHKIDRELHRSVVESAGLRSLLKCWESVVEDQDAWILNVQKSYWPSLVALYREHIFLLDAWCSPDDGVAENATHQHLEAGWHRVAASQGGLVEKMDPVLCASSFLSTHYASKVNVAWLARHICFVSEPHLIRLFQAQQGIPPHAYLIRVRLDRAAQLLRSGSESVAAVARRVGYRNASHFVRAFRAHFGVTPRAYRHGKGRPRGKSSSAIPRATRVRR